MLLRLIELFCNKADGGGVSELLDIAGVTHGVLAGLGVSVTTIYGRV